MRRVVGYKVLTTIGAFSALVGQLALLTALITESLGGQKVHATDPAAFFIFTGMTIVGLGLMICGAIVARRSGRQIQLWWFGLDALFGIPEQKDDSPTTIDGNVCEQAHTPAKGLTAEEALERPHDWQGIDRRSPYRPQSLPLWNNFISYIGFFLAATGTILILTFGLFSLVSPQSNPYVDIVGYLVLPSILVIGLIIVPVGIFFKSWRVRRKNPGQRLAFRFPRVDLNDPMQRRAAKVLVVGTFVMMPVVGVSSYHGYHYTDSADFCAKACHSAMEPQATTYEHSAHARVSCAECHIGEGAGWFVKSKLSGTRQVFAMWNDSFPRPIPTAITELRPARETCERCHWPKKFFGAQLRKMVHFGSDEKNTRIELDMLLKIGGGDESIGRVEGIHKHMALEGKIDYVATDDKLQVIPWVKFVDKTGAEWIYRSDGRPSSDPKPDGTLRNLDCMDCHNRPAHKFRSPDEAIDIFLDVGRIDTTLPFIKREAVKALIGDYADRDTAESEIGLQIMDFYKSEYPQLWETRKASIKQAVDMTRQVYRQNFFPRMNVNWRTYPDNIGHKNSPGCFRCHDGNHINQAGIPISHECHICHTFLNPVQTNGHQGTIQEGEFVHPYELEGSHAALRCDQCHTGGVTPVADCAGCHQEQQTYRLGTHEMFTEFEITPDSMSSIVQCEACHDLAEPTNIETIDAVCMDCHEDEEEKYEGLLTSWNEEVTRGFQGLESVLGDEHRAVLKALRRAGPFHNMEATRTILQSLAGQPNRATVD